MSLEWTTQQLRTPLSRLIEPPRFNPRPRGEVRPGSAADAVLRLLRSTPERSYWRHQVIHHTGCTRKAVDWALSYLQALQLIEVSETPGVELGGCQRLPKQRFRIRVEPAVRRGRGRPPKPDTVPRTVVSMRIREDLAPRFYELGREWLEQAVAAAEFV